MYIHVSQISSVIIREKEIMRKLWGIRNNICMLNCHKLQQNTLYIFGHLKYNVMQVYQAENKNACTQ